jgi:hypothetical protein
LRWSKEIASGYIEMPKSKLKADGDNETDWITALAQQATDAVATVPSKAERVAKRQAKRQRQQQQQQKRKKSKASLDSKTKPMGQTISSRNRHVILIKHWRQKWEDLTATFRARPYSPAFLTSDRRPRNYLHTVQHHRRIPITKVQQPRSKSAYGGLGLAQPTLYLAFSDPNWKALLVQDFGQHVAGWSGKAPMTQAMKKQRDSNLLWRRLQSAKQQQQQQKSGSSSKKAQKLKPPPVGDTDLQTWLDQQQLM